MGVSAHHVESRTRGRLPSGRRLAALSAAMIPSVIPAYVVAYLVGTALLSVLGLSEDARLTEAGVLGVACGVLLAAVTVVPQVAGVAFGLRARQLGERRLGAACVLVNALIGAYLVLVNLAGLTFA